MTTIITRSGARYMLDGFTVGSSVVRVSDSPLRSYDELTWHALLVETAPRPVPGQSWHIVTDDGWVDTTPVSYVVDPPEVDYLRHAITVEV